MNQKSTEEFDVMIVQGIRYKVLKKSEIKNFLFATLRSEWGEEEFSKRVVSRDGQLGLNRRNAKGFRH